MPSTAPFVDPATGELDTAQILSEAIPLGKLVGLFGAISLIPFTLAYVGTRISGGGAILVVIAQFILAVGTGIVLMYIIARGIHLSGE
jgi:hypothetical protein